VAQTCTVSVTLALRRAHAQAVRRVTSWRILPGSRVSCSSVAARARLLIYFGAGNGEPPVMRIDDDGVRTIESGATRRLGWLIAAAIGVPIGLTIIAIVAIRMAPARSAVPAPPSNAQPPRAPAVVGGPEAARAAVGGAPILTTVAAPAVAREHVVPHRIEKPKAAPSPGDDEEPNIDARDAIPALIAAGETGGITVFPLPGTKPIKRGLIVPDDFPLPEGYVRHYQTTDDGEQLPAILMFHPDYDFVNDRGEPITVPADRVVPEGLAPPGLPNQMLDVPDKPHESRLP
jgi:hypothetical protein